MSEAANDSIIVRNPKVLAVDHLPAQRIPLGKPGDYKPCIAKMPNGELLVVAFDGVKMVGDKLQEDMLLWRSSDGGRTWSQRQVIPPVGREPYFSVLKDGTIFISVHFLSNDIRNKKGYIYSLLHRSTDGGRTWDSTDVGYEDLSGAPEKANISTGRNVVQLHDGTLIFGVGTGQGHEYLWRSTDNGETWDKSQRMKYEKIDQSILPYPIIGEAFLWQTRAGDLLAVCRITPKFHPPLPGTEVPQTEVDHYERMLLYRSNDGGHNWAPEEFGPHYGEMYPAVLRLQDGRLLFTLTLRSVVPPNVPPMGVQAALGVEKENGFEFDFENDRLVLDGKTPETTASGGGFGPTVQIDDGTLLTSYSYAGPGEWGKDLHVEVVRWRLP